MLEPLALTNLQLTLPIASLMIVARENITQTDPTPTSRYKGKQRANEEPPHKVPRPFSWENLVSSSRTLGSLSLTARYHLRILGFRDQSLAELREF